MSLGTRLSLPGYEAIPTWVRGYPYPNNLTPPLSRVHRAVDVTYMYCVLYTSTHLLYQHALHTACVRYIVHVHTPTVSVCTTYCMCSIHCTRPHAYCISMHHILYQHALHTVSACATYCMCSIHCTCPHTYCISMHYILHVFDTLHTSTHLLYQHALHTASACTTYCMCSMSGDQKMLIKNLCTGKNLFFSV